MSDSAGIAARAAVKGSIGDAVSSSTMGSMLSHSFAYAKPAL